MERKMTNEEIIDIDREIRGPPRKGRNFLGLRMKYRLNRLKNETSIYQDIRNTIIKIFEDNYDKFIDNEDDLLFNNQDLEDTLFYLIRSQNIILFLENQNDLDLLNEFVYVALLYDRLDPLLIDEHMSNWNIIFRDDYDENKKYEMFPLYLFMFYDDFLQYFKNYHREKLNQNNHK